MAVGLVVCCAGAAGVAAGFALVVWGVVAGGFCGLLSVGMACLRSVVAGECSVGCRRLGWRWCRLLGGHVGEDAAESDCGAERGE